MGHVHDLRPIPETWLHGVECTLDGCEFVLGTRDAALLLTKALAALEAVEWVDGQEPAKGMGGAMEQVCPWCGKVGTSDDGWAHNTDCLRQAAIAKARRE